MATAAPAFAPAPEFTEPDLPPPPSSIEESGLHPDSLSQLLLKTLVAGEASGTGLADRMRPRYERIKARLPQAAAVYADETSWYVAEADPASSWLWRSSASSA